MAVETGRRLGSYEILTPLGSGGMGDVYRARDTKLDRDVAIKVLPPQLADSATALGRFEREAKAVAALSHPNILAIFDFGREGDIAYAVMELLEGETLRQKLVAPIPARKAIDYGVQIARGLAAAHDRGIVHRDLKPENLFVTTDGRVKILDFGLARQTFFAAPAGATSVPTVERHTDPGTVLGTVGYMSPEQARGEADDHRADLFSLGAVLYELVSGRRAFQRDTAPETLTAILRDDVPTLTSSSQADVPPGLARVIEHCLEKAPGERFQSASDIAFALENLSGASAAIPAVKSVRTQRQTWLPWSTAALFALVSVALALTSFRRPATTDTLTRLSVPFPAGIPYVGGGTPRRGLAISPEGRRILYVGSTGAGRRQLYSRWLDRLTIDPVPGTDGAYQPFFSPDGKWLAFFTITGELKKVLADGGQPVTLARGIPNAQRGFGVWRPDNIVVFGVFSGLFQVSADGGTPAPMTTFDATRKEGWHNFPQAVPGTGDILFTVGLDDGSTRLDLIRWSSRQRSTVIENASNAILTISGHVVFNRDQAVMVALFDATRGVVGPVVPLPDAVNVDDSSQWRSAQLAVSPSGTMVYVPDNPKLPAATFEWIDRSGKVTDVGPLPAGSRVNAALAVHGNAAAVLVERRAFLFDLVRNVTTPIDLGSRQIESVGWHPDGKRIVLGGTSLSLFEPDSGRDIQLTDVPGVKQSASFSPDGRTVVYQTFDPNDDIVLLSLDPGAKPRRFVATEAIENNPAISPDGRWMASPPPPVATPTAEPMWYVVRFPEGTGKVQITDRGGGAPFWSRDSRELFFPAPPGVLEAVTITAGDSLRVGPARPLFPLGGRRMAGVAPDGSRFLAVRMPPAEQPTEMIVVQNWLSELNRIAPAK